MILQFGIPKSLQDRRNTLISPAHIGEREIREVMLEPFKKCIDAGLMAIMPSHNEIDGIPVHASKKYLRQILRDEMGFDGVITSDLAVWNFLARFII